MERKNWTEFELATPESSRARTMRDHWDQQC